MTNFLSAYNNKDQTLVTDLKSIAKHYILDWFFFDLISGIPFSFFMGNDQANAGAVAKLAKAPRLYKITKLAKLFRIVKVVKKKKMFKSTNTMPGTSRFISSLLITITIIHIVSCLWIFITSFDSENNNWMTEKKLLDESLWTKYTIATYWTIQTVLTVGYGDVPAITINEKMFACAWMLLGVMVYSFLIGSVSSILAYTNTKQEQDLHILNYLSKIKTEYNLPANLYIKAKKAVKYQAMKMEDSDYQEFLDILPFKLKRDVGYIINMQKLSNIPFFLQKPKEFIAIIGPILKKVVYVKGDIIYNEGDHSN